MDERYKRIEIRSFSGDASPRIADGESRTIEGYAIVFGVRSQVMVDYGGEYFEEVILPEAVSEELIRKSDIKALMEHNRERLLARSAHGVGTLELSIDSFGLKYRFTAPNTTDGNDALELVRRGDLSGSSFGFYAYSDGAVEREWQSERQMWLYSIRKIDLLTDVTITSSPAYTQTQVEVRSLCAPVVEGGGEAVQSIVSEPTEGEATVAECAAVQAEGREVVQPISASAGGEGTAEGGEAVQPATREELEAHYRSLEARIDRHSRQAPFGVGQSDRPA